MMDPAKKAEAIALAEELLRRKLWRQDYTARKWAEPFHANLKRWACLVLHRRAGKTVASLYYHQRAALDNAWEIKRLLFLKPELTREAVRPLLRDRFYGHILPTYRQADLTGWPILKRISEHIPGIKKNESELSITYPNGSIIQLFGSDKPDRLRGPAFSGLSFDEYSQQAPNIFGEVLSKALADHLGYAIFLGTIKGKNHLYKMYQATKDQAEWFSLWQDVTASLAQETDIAAQMIGQAMEDDRKLIALGQMNQSEFDQEWFLSPEAAVKGAWFGTEMDTATKQGRVGRVPYDPILPVDTYWDLGIADAMSVWFVQSTRAGEVRLIDYYENSGEGFPHYIQLLKEKGYIYGKHYAPHDIEVRELSSGRSRKEVADELGLKFLTLPRTSFADGVHSVRMILPTCYFDEEHCASGIEALRQYRKKWNSRLNEFTEEPEHDVFSHAADSFRGMATRQKPPKPEAGVDEFGRREGIVYTGGPGTSRRWMA